MWKKSLLNVDSYSKVQELTKAGFSPEQSEILLDLCKQIIQSRLTPFKDKFISIKSANLSPSIMSTRLEQHSSTIQSNQTANSLDLKTRQDRLGTEITALNDQLKEMMALVKTELGLRANEAKADAREAIQKAEMSMHRMEGRITVDMGTWRQKSENTKLRAIYLFSVSLFGLFSSILFIFTLQQKKLTRNAISIDPDQVILNNIVHE